VPYLLVVGDKEKAAGQVAVRARGTQAGGANLGVTSVESFAERLAQDVAGKKAQPA